MTFINPTDSPDFFTGPGFGSGVLVNQIIALNSGQTQLFGPFYVGNASALDVVMKINNGKTGRWEYFWSQAGDVAATVTFVSTYEKYLGTLITRDRIACAGTYVMVRITNTDAINWTGFFTMVTSTPTSGTLAINERTLISPTAVTVPATSTVLVQPSTNVPGEAVLWCNLPSAGASVSVLSFAQGSANKFIYQIVWNAGGPSTFIQTISLPGNDWQLGLSNGSGASIGISATITTMR